MYKYINNVAKLFSKSKITSYLAMFEELNNVRGKSQCWKMRAENQVSLTQSIAAFSTAGDTRIWTSRLKREEKRKRGKRRKKAEGIKEEQVMA